MKASLAFGPFLPDQSEHSGVLRTALNVYPAIDGYRPVGAFHATSDPLDEDFQGGGSFVSDNGEAYLLAGTASDLYRLAAGAWTSLVDSLTITQRWRFAQFGNYVVAVNGSDTREIDLASATDSVLADAPTGTSIAVVRDFVVIGQADGDILLVQWSGLNDHTEWTPGTDQSGFQPMLSGGEVMGLAGGEYGIILQRFRLVRMTYTGEENIWFQFDEITPNVGCASKASIAQAGRMVFFLSDRGFMALEDGQALKPIGNEKVDRSFQAEISRDDYERIYATVDPQNSLVMWGVPGEPGKIWCYNWVLDRWSIISLSFSGFFPGYTVSMTLEEVSAEYTDLDTMPYSLDDPRFAGGEPRVYVVDRNQELGTLIGPSLEAVLALGFSEPARGRMTRLRQVRALTDATGGLSLSVDARRRLGDAPSEKTTTSLRDSGIMPLRSNGRYMKPSITIAAGTRWSYIQGLELDFEAGGER